MNFLKKAAKKTFDKVQQQINDDHAEEDEAGPTDYEGRFYPEKGTPLQTNLTCY